jgi:hypothetical protein
MARQQRSNNSTFSQEPDRQIVRVALYARVSTLNNQDPGMQLSELRGVAVEKLDLSENRPKRSDQKCIGGRRKSFIGHPDATHFRRKFCERVFQQLQASLTMSAVSSVF